MAFRCALERGNERDRSRFMASSLRTSERPLFCFGKSELLPFSPFPFLFWYHSTIPIIGSSTTDRQAWPSICRWRFHAPLGRFSACSASWAPKSLRKEGLLWRSGFFRNPPKLVRGGRRRTWSKLGAAAERSRERENGRFICYPKEARTFL